MALLATVETNSGINQPLYIRVNNAMESRHGVDIPFLVRGFISEEAFRDDKHFVHEEEFMLPLDQFDVDKPLRNQCYEYLKTQIPDAQDC